MKPLSSITSPPRAEPVTKCIARAGAAMRVNGVLTWLMVDQVGSTSVTSDINGALGDTVKYSAFGEVRAGGTATDYLYTSQRNEAEIGLDYCVARFYDPVTGHFIQADTIVPEAGSSKAYDRYGYVSNNPVRHNDPSGHCISGVVADTVFCVFVAAMAIGAIVDGAENAIAQYRDSGSIDWTEVTGNAMEGAVIAGAPFVALAAAPTILTTTSYGLSSASSSLAKAYSIPGAQQAAKTQSQASGSALSGSSAITNFLGSPMPGSSPVYCRYCSNAELKAIQDTGFLRGGIKGPTYFTTDNYTSASNAQANLE